jgi:membrane-bound serine protease (ClpP class)
MRRRAPVALLASSMLLLVGTAAFAGARVNLATISGSINPASADYLLAAIDQSEREDADALLIELDTPGGLVSSTKDIIQAILNSEVPVIVYVSPRGAWAASAGTYITVAGHVAAMAPSSSIGAAHPVGIGGGDEAPRIPGVEPEDESGKDDSGESDSREPPPGQGSRNLSMEKAENLLAAYIETIARERDRNVEWVVKAVRESVAIGEEEALELGVIDLVAENRAQLFEALAGREVEVAGVTVTLELADATVTPIEMTTLQSLFDFLADPNVAIVLFLAGLLGLYVEVNNPGLIVPGVAGAVCLVLTAIAFQILPFSWVGLILILAGLGLFAAEVFVTSFGALFVLGAACILLGGTMVFDKPNLSDLTVSFWSVLVPTVLGMCIFAAIVVFSVGRSMLLKQASGVDEMIGLVGQATTAIDPKGKIFVRGEYWNVESDAPGSERGAIAAGEAVEVVGVDGLTLRVRRATHPA